MGFNSGFKGLTSYISVGARVLSKEQNNRGVMLTTQINLVPKLKLSGYMLPIPLHVFKVRTGTILPSFIW